MDQNKKQDDSSVLEGLTFDVTSEDGHMYAVAPWQPDIQAITDTWEKYSKYRILFSDVSVNNAAMFTQMVMSPTSVVLTMSCDGKEVGLYYITELRTLTSAHAHYAFWDRRQNGRRKLILTTARRIMEQLELHRLNVSVPIYAFSALSHIHKMGLRIEGRRTEAILYQGRWADKLEFGVLRSELTDEALENGRLVRTQEEASWHGLLKDHTKLMRRVLRVPRSIWKEMDNGSSSNTTNWSSDQRSSNSNRCVQGQGPNAADANEDGPTRGVVATTTG